MIVTIRQDERPLAEIAAYYSKKGRLPRTKAALVSQIIGDFAFILRTNERSEYVSTIEEAITIMNAFSFVDAKDQQEDLKDLDLRPGEGEDEDLKKALELLNEEEGEQKDE